MALNIRDSRDLGYRSFSSTKFQKALTRVTKLSEEDSWWNEFLSFARPMPVGGEYMMPADRVMDVLEDIYGSGPDINNIPVQEEEEDDESDILDLEGLERVRRKPLQGKWSELQPKKATLKHGTVAGMSRYVGNLPKEIYLAQGNLGLRGGSMSEDFQDCWISGASVRYDFEADPLAAEF